MIVSFALFACATTLLFLPDCRVVLGLGACRGHSPQTLKPDLRDEEWISTFIKFFSIDEYERWEPGP